MSIAKVTVSRAALRKVLDYLEADESEHFDSMDEDDPGRSNHIYLSVEQLRKEMDA